MKTKMPRCFLATGILLLSMTGAAFAEQDCGVFPSQERLLGRDRLRGDEDRYRSCEECLRENDRCEERCIEQGAYLCTAFGYDRRDNKQTVQGESAERERRARRSAIRRCQEQGLIDCEVERCTEEWSQGGADRVQPCPEPRREWDSARRGRGREDRPLPPANPVAPPARTEKYVVSWQHVKEQCLGKPYEKIAQQCGNNVNFWHGIRCRVTWSDGRVEELGGKVDQTDAYGRAYCTRDTRPANFNCVNQCDDSPGPLITLPKP